MNETMSGLTDEERWQAVAGRDGRADDAFRYGVRTTGVYCRPSCASRLPNRGNVEFFETSEHAERHGYRACKKCRPAAADLKPVPDVVVRACGMIDAAAEPPSLAELARAVRCSPGKLHRQFKAAVGVTPRAYAAARRAERLREGLRTEPTVTDAVYAAGFASSSRCYETAARDLGMTPSEYRAGGADQTLRFAVAECALGWVAVAATERGICRIELGDTPDALRASVAAAFPKAALVDGEEAFQAWVERVVAQIETPARVFDLPLDLRGTAFQRQVWDAFRSIPPGSTATYSEVAARIGRPAAVRAVARACAANPLAVVIPCHRVVRKDGTLSGYRWDVSRKRALLERETER